MAQSAAMAAAAAPTRRKTRATNIPGYQFEAILDKQPRRPLAGRKATVAQAMTRRRNLRPSGKRQRVHRRELEVNMTQRHTNFFEWRDVRPQIPGNWQQGERLGDGGQGVVFGFVDLSADGLPVQYIVVKENMMDDWTWIDLNQWVGNVYDVNKRRHVEIVIMEKLTAARNTTHCVGLQGSEIDNDGRTYRIIMDYCHRGDLWSVYEHYSRKDNQPIPEPALWAMAHGLVRACSNLSYGSDDPRQPRPRWKPIVHRDITPANVYLNTNTTNDFPSYPIPVLGDFGLSVFTDDKDKLNPTFRLGMGTQGWQAYEAISWMDNFNLRPWYPARLGIATNTWAIGAILYKLILPERQVDYLQDPVPPFLDSIKPSFSQDLQDMILECLRSAPESRPTLQELRDRIDRFTGLGQNGEVDHSQGLRTRRLNPGDPNTAWFPRDFLHEHFAQREDDNPQSDNQDDADDTETEDDTDGQDDADSD